MTIESGTYISDLNSSNPGASDLKAEGDDHLRLIKSFIKASFPNITGAMTATQTQINNTCGGVAQISAAGAISAVTDLTTTGNTILGDATTDTLNVGAGGLIKDTNGNTGFGTTATNVGSGYRVVENKGSGAGGGGIYRSTSSDGVVWGDFYSVAVGGAAGGTSALRIGSQSATQVIFTQAATDRIQIDTSGNFVPVSNNTYTNGSSIGRWSNIYSVLGNFSGNLTAATVSTTGDNNGLGLAIVRVKAAVTSRQSTTTFADDPDLIVPLSAGKFAVKAWVPFNAASSGGMGMKARVAFSGTQTNSPGSFICNETTFTTQATDMTTGMAASTVTTSPAPGSWFLLEGCITVTVAGNLSIQWAQNSSTAVNLNFNAGAYISCTKVA